MIAAVAMTGCKEDDPDEPPAEPLAVTFDRAEYYPFDVAQVQLPDAATAETYEGTLGGQPVMAVRVADSTLAVPLPDLAAAEYALSLKVAGAVAEGKLKVKAVPEVANPEAVIEEMTAEYAALSEAMQRDNRPNAAVAAAMLELFNTELARLTPAERARFAALRQVHPEWGDFPAFDGAEAAGLSRTSVISRSEQLLRYTVRYLTSVAGVMVFADAFMKSVAVMATGAGFLYGLMGMAATGLGALACLDSALKYADRVERYAFALKAIVMDGDETLLKAGGYDCTLTAGGQHTFSVQASYRSITAADAGSANGTVADIIAATDRFRSVWDRVAGGINTMRERFPSIPAPDPAPKRISEITEPLTTGETEAAEDWTLRIISGNVQAVKASANTYKFTTTEEEDVEFTFRITAEGVESKVYTGLLEVPEKGYDVVGKWKAASTWTVVYEDGRPDDSTVSDGQQRYFTFIPDGRVLYERDGIDSSNGSPCHVEEYLYYSYNGNTNTGSINLGTWNSFYLQSETTLVITDNSWAGRWYFQYWTKVAE
jgi:hypothetical protein